MDRDLRTLWCGNLSNRVTEDVLYELFLQAGPLEEVKIPKDRDNRPRAYGFVTYKHDESVDYALQLFRGTVLYNRELNIDRKVRLPPDQPPQQQDIQFLPMSNGPVPNYGMLIAYPPPYASHDQHYRGPMNMYPSNNRRNSSRIKNQYHRH